MISIRRCESDDVHPLMDFIEQHWKQGHVLAHSKRLMDWQHATASGYNYILAWDGDVLIGALGYIPTARFDASLTGTNILWLALWKMRRDYNSSLIGVKLLYELSSLEPNIGIAVNGINDSVARLYGALGYATAELKQYCLVNVKAERALLKYPKGFCLPKPKHGPALLKIMSASDLEKLKLPIDSLSHKTPAYFIERFIKHPFYEYKVYGVQQDKNISALLALRTVRHQDAAAVRIVDFSGDVTTLASCGTALQGLMESEGAEYVDFWQYGIPDSALVGSGFQRVNPDGDFICPNYFEPFDRSNARICCAFKTQRDSSLIICKADGDQDRPNILSASD